MKSYICDVIETNAPANGQSVLKFMMNGNVPLGNCLVVTASYRDMVACASFLQAHNITCQALTDAYGEINDFALGNIIFNNFGMGSQALVAAAYTLDSLPSFLWINSLHLFCKPDEVTGMRLIGGMITPYPGKHETTRVFVYGVQQGTAIQWLKGEEANDDDE